jgi:hypothetical protein
MLTVGGPGNVTMPGILLENSILATAKYPIWSTGAYGTSDCAHYDIPVKTVSLCFSGYTFSPNAFLDSPPAYPSSSWPTDNYFYSSTDIGFVNYSKGNGGDYHLLPSSPAKGMASDGLDLGANVDEVMSAIAGVR